LRAVDPESAGRLHPHDQRRIIRALEVLHLTGITHSAQLEGQKRISPYELCFLGLTMDRAMLYARINERVDAMIADGLVDEMRGLLQQGVKPGAVSMQGLGYKEIALYLEGHLSLEEAIVLLKRDTRRYAKRQLSWFRRMKDIHWIDSSENFHKNLLAIHDIIAGKFRGELEYTSNQSF
ncbi:tRNA (adenosine(37)-N6)-dimethylallyltransferase MiaA, partial [Paenibacillus sepulcri]|nr:tRNA (adenosine(37)-N6)-dimethylallyltransferase MiaA [Paenibacillus sepulcri]